MEIDSKVKLDSAKLISDLENMAGMKLNRVPQIDGILDKPQLVMPTLLSSFMNYREKPSPHQWAIYSLYNALTWDRDNGRDLGRTLCYLESQGIEMMDINRIIYLLYRATKSQSSNYRTSS